MAFDECIEFLNTCFLDNSKFKMANFRWSWGHEWHWKWASFKLGRALHFSSRFGDDHIGCGRTDTTVFCAYYRQILIVGVRMNGFEVSVFYTKSVVHNIQNRVMVSGTKYMKKWCFFGYILLIHTIYNVGNPLKFDQYFLLVTFGLEVTF